MSARGVAALLLAALLGGCSAEAWKRSGYETLQNLRQRECREEPGEPCPERQRYEDYQQDRPA